MKLSENQQTLLGLVPDDFKGTLNEKLVYGEFIHCNNCAINRNEKTFTLGFAQLEKETELGRTTLSKIVNDFIRRDVIGRCEIGTSTKNKNSTYYTFVCSNKHVQNEHTANSNLNIQSPCESDSYGNGEHTGEHTGMFKVNTNYNFNNNYNNINLKALLNKIDQLTIKVDQLEGRLDKASEVVRTLKKRIKVLEENNNNSTPDKGTTGKGTVKVNKDNSQFEMYNREFTELVAVMKDKTSTRDKIISTAAQIEYMIVNGMLNSKQVKYGQDLISQYRDNVKADQNQVKSSTLNKPTPQVAHTPLPTVWLDQRLEEDWNGFYRRYTRINSGEMFEDLAVDTLESAELIKKYIDSKLLPESQTKWFNHYWMLDGDRKKGLTSKVEADCRSFLNMPNEFKEIYDKALEAEIPNENLAVSE